LPDIRFTAADATELAGKITAPDDPNGGGTVLCHPHPQQGGSMHSWMMPVLQRALVGDGWVGLRFDFRGVGESDGSFGGGEDELLDVAGAVDRVLEETDDGAPLLLVGWSFGAHVALRYAVGDDRVDGWVGIGLPVGLSNGWTELEQEHLARWDRPKLFIHGEDDPIAPLDAVREVVEVAAGPNRLRVLEGGDHFLADHGDVLASEVRAFGREVLDAVGASR
jgi:uncharacterized protein